MKKMIAAIKEDLLVLIPQTEEDAAKLKKWVQEQGARIAIPEDPCSCAITEFQNLKIAIL